MSSATLTLIGLYNFLDYQEKDLFEKLVLPDGIDKDTCINNILLKADDKELLYPDSGFMIDAIGMWSTKWNRTFQKWIDVLSMEYNPIENYDRKEAWSDSTSSSEQNSLSSSESTQASSSDSSQGSTSALNDVSAFNSSTMVGDTSASEQNNNTATSSSSANNLKSTLDTFDKEGLTAHRGRVHGNIGVTTTQQMIQSEIDLDRFNIYDEIAIIFVREFCLAL